MLIMKLEQYWIQETKVQYNMDVVAKYGFWVKQVQAL